MLIKELFPTPASPKTTTFGESSALVAFIDMSLNCYNRDEILTFLLACHSDVFCTFETGGLLIATEAIEMTSSTGYGGMLQGVNERKPEARITLMYRHGVLVRTVKTCSASLIAR
jgi:hypothetical protein